MLTTVGAALLDEVLHPASHSAVTREKEPSSQRGLDVVIVLS
jgi:hypothetical protein